MLERSAIIWGGCWLNVEWSVSPTTLRWRDVGIMRKPIVIAMLIVLGTTALNARPTRNFQFWEFGYQWTTDSGNAPGPGSFSPSHVSPLSSSIALTLTETSSGSIVGRRGANRGSLPLRYFPVEGDMPNTFWVTNWVGTSNKKNPAQSAVMLRRLRTS